MFGMSFGELVILGVIAIVVVGPRRLPTLLRGAGQLIGHLRRMAVDVRKESGIDQLLEAEGINKEIDTFRRLAAGEVGPDVAPNVPAVPAIPGAGAGSASEAAGAPTAAADPYAPQPPEPAAPPTPPAPSEDAKPK